MQMDEQVHNHPLNDSPSKQQFSFPKAPRFREYRSPYALRSLTQVQYTLPSTFNKKGYSFGNAQRKSIIGDCRNPEKSLSPAPGAYTPSSRDDKIPGWSFGCSKKAETPGSRSSKHLTDNPGPGAYNITPEDFGKFANKYSMRAKASPPRTLYPAPRSQTPGPGSYHPRIDINALGVYFASNVPSSRAPRISPSCEIVRKVPLRMVGPGPGAYDPKTNISKDGAYFVSNIHSTQCRSFGKEVRSHSVHRLQTPGPGSYRVPSDFGFYDASLENQTPSRKELTSRGKL